MITSIAASKGADLSLPITGELFGTVVDSSGTPQMGASVQVFNKYQRFIARAFTNPDGRFAFDNLTADNYSVRVSLDSFLPAVRDNVLIKAGFGSDLQIHLATLFSNIEVNYRVPTGAMSDDWKWVLRSSPATRPITRLVDPGLEKISGAPHPKVFSETRAMLSVSGGDGGMLDSSSPGLDLGTTFALSTNVLGKNQVQVAGTFGAGPDLGPTAMALCAIYNRTEQASFASAPEVSLSISQIGGLGSQAPNAAGASSNAGLAGIPVIRSVSLSFYQTADPMDNVHLEYGMTGESVEYVQHAARISPFARLTVDLKSAGKIVAAYSDGGRPNELSFHQQDGNPASDIADADLSEPVDALSRLPQMSDRNNRLELEKTHTYETGYSKSAGSRTYAISGFLEDVSNGRLDVAGDLSGVPNGDLFSDGISTVSTLNIGRYQRSGYLASADQKLGDLLEFALAYGRLGGFASNGNAASADDRSASPRFLSEKQSNLASVNIKASLPRPGTRISVNYGWIDPRTIIPNHAFTTQDVAAQPGLNILIRQPLPSFFGIAGHLELTGDLRNLLADGYTPVSTGDGRQLLLIEAPRAIRGGLNFIF